ncbi:GntR family transcriptional regulator [Virgibacillus sp. W0181]|uniref:GntR family transcriptional regulator n=1 Tax=Virgibacillus sp. W0181 TaxID=3391581 RepID=UPI003F45B40B
MIKVKKNPSLPDIIYEKLLTSIQDGTWKVGEKLASEKELATRLNVSRAVLRESLQRLELDGYIDRRHGVGTFVRHMNPKLMAGLEKLDSMTTFIERHGLKPGTTEAMVQKITVTEEIQKHLQLKMNEQIIRFERVRTTDSIPFAFDIVIGSTSVLDRAFTTSAEKESIFKYLEEEKKTTITHSHCTIFAENATPEIAGKLHVNTGEALQVLEQVYYENDVPLYYGKSYINADLLQFHVIRRR